MLYLNKTKKGEPPLGSDILFSLLKKTTCYMVSKIGYPFWCCPPGGGMARGRNWGSYLTPYMRCLIGAVSAVFCTIMGVIGASFFVPR